MSLVPDRPAPAPECWMRLGCEAERNALRLRTLEDLAAWIKARRAVAVDTERRGGGSRDPDVVQIGTDEFVALLDLKRTQQVVTNVLRDNSSPPLFYFWAAPNDSPEKLGVPPERVFDVQSRVSELVGPPRKGHLWALHDAYSKYSGTEYTKDGCRHLRRGDWTKRPLSAEKVLYAKADVVATYRLGQALFRETYSEDAGV